MEVEAPALHDAATICHISIMIVPDAAQVYTAPLEFKSGRPHQSHRAQVPPSFNGQSQQIDEPAVQPCAASHCHASFAVKHAEAKLEQKAYAVYQQ